MKRETFMTGVDEPVKVFDGPFTWKNQFNVSTCQLQIYTVGRKRLALAFETSENKGMSITNGAEILWLEVIKRFGACSCFETHDGEFFDLVEINRGKASWLPVGMWDKVLEEYT